MSTTLRETDRTEDAFTRICEEPLNKNLMAKYRCLPWTPTVHGEPAFLEILDFISRQLNRAASSLQDLATHVWWQEKAGSLEEEERRNRFLSLFDLITDKSHDLDVLCEFTRATFHNDPVVLMRLQCEAAEPPQGPAASAEHEESSALTQ